jgi:SagB-type dehydrogenase family enzyme
MKTLSPLPATAAEEYHLESSNRRILKETPSMHQINYEPRIMQLVRDAPLHIESAEEKSAGITLPLDQEFASMSVEEAITTRVSTRWFSAEPLPLAKLGKVLFLANGARKNSARGIAIDRNVPNSGGLGSVEIYCIALNVAGVDPGIYHFDSVFHELRVLKKGAFGTWLREFVCFQYEASEPPVVLVLTSAVGRLTSKYGPRGYRLGLLDTGHASENIYLSATALHLNVFAFGGFVDEEVNRALDLEGLERCAFLSLGIGCR